jgi:hypothetical protein
MYEMIFYTWFEFVQYTPPRPGFNGLWVGTLGEPILFKPRE